MTDSNPSRPRFSFRVLTGSPQEVEGELNRLDEADKLARNVDGGHFIYPNVSPDGETVVALVRCVGVPAPTRS